MTTNYGERPGLTLVHADEPDTLANHCDRCAVALTDDNRHDVHDDLCLDCGERKEQRIAESQEDRIVDAAREAEMRREWGAK